MSEVYTRSLEILLICTIFLIGGWLNAIIPESTFIRKETSTLALCARLSYGKQNA